MNKGLYYKIAMDEFNQYQYRIDGGKDCTLSELSICPHCKNEMNLYSITTPSKNPTVGFDGLGEHFTIWEDVPGKLVFRCLYCGDTEKTIEFIRMEIISIKNV